MSSVGNGSVSSKSSTTHKFSAHLKDLLGAAKRVLGHEKDIDNLDQILDEKRKLEGKLKLRDAEIKTKDKEIASLQSAKIHEVTELKSAKETLFREFQDRFTTWDTGTTKQKELERQVADLKVELKRVTKRADSTQDDLADLQKDFDKSEGALEDATEKLKNVTKELRSKERELTGALKELEYFQEDKALLGPEDLDHDDLIIKFNAFAERCHGLAQKFFLTELPKDITSEDLWTELCSSGFSKVAPRSMPISNSLPSQYLRMATVEKIIASKLCGHVFQQYYLPTSVSARQVMDDVMNRLLKDNPHEEAIFRLRLLSAYKRDEHKYLTNVVTSTVSEVVGILGRLLAPDSQNIFRLEIEKLLQEAIKLWGPVQRSAVRAFVENEPEEDWTKYRDYDTPMGPSSGQAVSVPSDPIQPLFPRVSIGNDVVCQGYALWSDQNAVIAAGVEYSHMRHPNKTHARTNSGNGGVTGRSNDRRKPSNPTAVGSKLVGMPMPPRSQSFAEHVSNRNTRNRLMENPSGE